IQGGTIALMNGTLVIDIARITYTNDPTTVNVTAPPPATPGQMPTSTGTTVTLQVNSLLDVGGRICVSKPGANVTSTTAPMCIFAGGVDRILMYEESSTGKLTFTIKNANLSVLNKFDMHLDFQYKELSGGVAVTFAGRGTIGPVGAAEAIIVGNIETGDNF